MTISPFSIEALLQRFRGNAAIVEEVLHEFELQATSDIESLATSLRASDGHKTASVAHALKGAAGILSAASVQRLAAELESKGASGEFEGAETCLARLRDEIADCVSHIAVAREQMPTLLLTFRFTG